MRDLILKSSSFTIYNKCFFHYTQLSIEIEDEQGTLGSQLKTYSWNYRQGHLAKRGIYLIKL